LKNNANASQSADCFAKRQPESRQVIGGFFCLPSASLALTTVRLSAVREILAGIEQPERQAKPALPMSSDQNPFAKPKQSE
jgi:hypothetical protein